MLFCRGVMFIFMRLNNPMRFIKCSFLFILSLSVKVCFSQTDSIPSIDSVMTAEANEEALQDYMIQTIQPFACRIFSTLVSYRDGYTSSMGRNDNNSRVSQLTGGFQALAKVNTRTTLGISITGRRLMLHDRFDPVTDIFKNDNSLNSDSYIRYLILQSRFNLSLKRNLLFISGNVFIPMNRDKEVIYGKRKFQDPVYKQINAQFIFYRKYSRYFSLNKGIMTTWRITEDPVNKVVMRGFLIPVFQHRLSSTVYLTASAELNALFVKPFFNNFYLNEKAGLLYNGPFGILYSFQYGYYALGKNSNAQHSFNVSLKREFKTIPIRKLRAS